jgi:hypothetical protein
MGQPVRSVNSIALAAGSVCPPTQCGKVVDIAHARGPIRLRRRHR